MIKNKRALIIAIGIYLALQGVLTAVRYNSEGKVFVATSYGIVILACVFCAVSAFDKTWEYWTCQIGLVFTVAADYFLVVCDPQVKLEAMLLFSVTQLSYCARLVVSDENKKRQRVQIVCHAALSVAMVVITRLVLGKGCDPVAVVSMFYYANLILNIVFSFMRFKKLYIFAIGLLLFAGCDTVIGLSLLKNFVSISQDSVIYKIIYPGFDLVWAFYIPSQVLIGMSLVPKKIKKLKNKE